MKRMMRCVLCGAYTLMQVHCGNKVIAAHPPRFNQNDKYDHYRRRWKGIIG